MSIPRKIRSIEFKRKAVQPVRAVLSRQARFACILQELHYESEPSVAIVARLMHQQGGTWYPAALTLAQEGFQPADTMNSASVSEYTRHTQRLPKSTRISG